VRRADRGHRRAAVGWTLATVALGAVFVVNQGLEWGELPFSAGDHAYGSIFYLATGFHGLHVIGGLVLMLAVLALATGRGARIGLAEPLTMAEYYWHFVDVVWIGLFASIYLLQ
jgi:cytochrome c oxidase subunit III